MAAIPAVRSELQQVLGLKDKAFQTFIEQVYIPDDGSLEFKGPSRAYGYETKLK